jgi:hypothetical protein
MSVILGDDLLNSGRPFTAALAGHGDFALAEITAQLARDCKQLVMRCPIPTEPAHAKVIGNKTHSIRKRMAKAAKWVIEPRADWSAYAS